MLRVLLEWERSFAASEISADSEPSRPADQARWALIRFSWLVWAAAVLAALITAWDGQQGLWRGLFRILNRSFAVGTLNLHLLGILYAVLILFAVHVVVRLWKSVIMGKILARRTMDRGLRESITTISVYLIWALGGVMALGAVGVSTTSLAVVFGALSIGIGFGLQNIFNNFISGIILLFERPIQVGDAVEINGTWGEIKKINVRATVVQTYDNASLIIPNSEFISSPGHQLELQGQAAAPKSQGGGGLRLRRGADPQDLAGSRRSDPSGAQIPPPRCNSFSTTATAP